MVVFILFIVFFMCIFKLVICCVIIIFLVVIWVFFLRKGGMLSFILRGKMFCICNFLLVMIMLLLLNFCERKLFCCIIFWLEIFFVYNWLMKVNVLFGKIFISFLRVIWCLYELNNFELRNKLYWNLYWIFV